MKRPSSASRRPLERGQFSWVTAVLVLAIGGAAYMGWVWVPVYLLHFEVKQVTRDFMNRAIKDRNDEQLVVQFCNKVQSLERMDGQDRFGEPTRVPVVDLQPDEVTWDRDTSVSPPMLRVAFEYVREVQYPFLDRTREVTLSIDLSQDLAIPNWGPAR
jgi:hypothetical protein